MFVPAWRLEINSLSLASADGKTNIAHQDGGRKGPHFSYPLFGDNIDDPSYLAFQQTPLETFWPFVVLAIGAMEIQSVSIFEEPFGPNGVGGDKWWTLKADRVPGDFGLDPLGLYPSDPEEQIEMKTKELNHCRLAMIGIAGMVVQELVSGQKLF